MDAAPSCDAIDVLTRSGEARDACWAQLDPRERDELDARLVSDVLRACGRVGATLDRRRALVELCAIVRAIDAHESGRIELHELRAGLDAHAARTDRFDEFHDARVLLRTLREVLGHAVDDATTRAARGQASLLHAELRAWLLEQLTGTGSIPPASEHRAAPSPLDACAVTDPDARAMHDAHVNELLHGARDHPVTGLLGAAWIRGWTAVPVAGEMLGDDLAELDRIAAALATVEPAPDQLVLVERRRAPAWQLVGARVVFGDRRRASWALPATRHGLELAATARTAWAVLTTPALDFAWVEGPGHHAVLGTPAFVEAACGAAPLEAMAAFREHVEELAGDGDPPPELLEVATSFGRLRRRSR